MLMDRTKQKAPSFPLLSQRIFHALLVLTLLAWSRPGHAEAPAASSGSAPATPRVGGPAPTGSSSSRPTAPTSSASSANRAPSAAPAAESSADAAEDKPSARVQELQQLARRIVAFRQGNLALDIDPKTLFEVPLDDDSAVRVERKRLAAIVTGEASAPGRDASNAPPMAENPAVQATPHSASTTAAAASSGILAKAEMPSPKEPDPATWQARMAVDRARLAIYELDQSARSQLLARHEARQKEQGKSAQANALSEAEQRAKQAAEARQEALKAARKARSEAARLVGEEQARLLQVAKQQAEFEAVLLKRTQALEERGERLLGLQRRVREALETVGSGSKESRAADATYSAVNAALGDARSQLAASLSDFIGAPSEVPTPGDNPLGGIPADIDTTKVDRLRDELETTAARLRAEEETLREQRVEHLYQEVETLNHARLDLLPLLSSAKRLEATSLSPSGLAEALGEAKQVALVLQYHLAATMSWLSEIQRPGSRRESSAMTASLVMLKWLLPIVVFIWWRRRADKVLTGAIDELKAKRARSTVGPSPLEKTLRYVKRVRSPVEWLLLLWAMLGLVPASFGQLPEVRLIKTIFGWTLGGTIAVNTIDFLAGETSERHTRRSVLYSAHLRLRSLRLAGRVVVTLGMVLSLTSLLVGKGTIYGWVLNFCWLAAVLLFLVILRWWRNIIFERVDYKRKKTPLETWIVNNRSGVRSFPAAVLGAALLLGGGISRFVKTWVGGFELTRRVLAYLFRREIKKKAEDQAKVVFSEIGAELVETLGPGTPSTELVASVADAQVGEVIDCINAPGGGVFAIVGERGAGKTTLLQRIAEGAVHVELVDCPFGGMSSFAPALLPHLDSDDGEVLEQAAMRFDAVDRNAGILIDNAHRLIQPAMGGLKHFDRVIEIARSYSKNTAWVFAFDSIIWQFFERMRGSRPLFDSVIRLAPWTDAGIANLITARCETAKVDVDFSHLLGELPPDADEIDVQEALDRTEMNYYRLIWDYADGNPGVALTVWHDSLGLDPEGHVSVKVFQAPDPEALEGLPDSTKFVLRAVIQLERADSRSISRATGVAISDVDDALRFGSARGYFDHTAEGYAVTWPWFRAITRYLARHHLLVSSARGEG